MNNSLTYKDIKPVDKYTFQPTINCKSSKIAQRSTSRDLHLDSA